MHQHRTRVDLMGAGFTSRDITRAVRSGELIRARRDRYLAGDTPDVVVRAVRVGGRLTCLSLLQLLGVFVLVNTSLHVHLSPKATRMRTPHSRAKRLRPARSPKTRLHWRELPASAGDAACVDIVVALAHAVRCQAPRAAVASIDSALNKQLLPADRVSAVFDLLPAKYRVLQRLVDGRAQSGPETLVRLMVHALGFGFDLQVPIERVGFVDLVVDGWLAIECDSKQFHSDWAQQLKDYRRDLELAKQGYGVLRLTAEDILYQPESVLAALRGLLLTGRR
ncbi:endonuclease domain-containing protein [Microbacterium hibisci]|uniref:endonuclease domain-containing protein n=1 Tax=Microbacterium hibisci TaxID=2036000 RepID=UPI001EF22F45|nr:DUF559 domain-containing protein [Microbacterium hibisci]